MKQPRKEFGSFAISVTLHVVLGAALLRVLSMPYPLAEIFRREAATKSLPVERIGFISLPPGEQTRPGRSGGDGQPLSPQPAPPPVQAPTEVPTGTPLVPTGAKPAETGGSGPLVGSGGPTEGVRPSFTDPRLWIVPDKVVSAPRTQSEVLDSVLAQRLQPVKDSIAVAKGRRAPTDWTVERNGRKYGIDDKFIRLGPVSIPTAMLALLPLNLPASRAPTVEDRTRERMRLEISDQARRRMNEDEFSRAVRAIRERKDRERAAEREAERAAATRNGAPAKERTEQPPVPTSGSTR